MFLYMKKGADNQSLFLYTALIFVVAIIMILISFFGQNKLQKSQPISTEGQSFGGITQKAALLSEENRILLEQNNDLSEKIEKKNEEISDMKKELQQMQDANVNYELLLSVNGYLSVRNTDKAKEVLSRVVVEELTEDQKILYDDLTDKLK